MKLRHVVIDLDKQILILRERFKRDKKKFYAQYKEYSMEIVGR